MRTLHRRREPVLGTVLEVQARGRRRTLAAVEAAVLGEIARLEAVFSVFRPDSELCRWRSGPAVAEVSGELAELLTRALALHDQSAGVFNAAAGELTAVWKEAEAHGEPPSDEVLRQMAGRLREPRYHIEGRSVTMTGDCSALDFNAFAKGLIVDLAGQHAFDRAEPDFLVVNIGGDLRHWGRGGAAVGIENPLRPFDNEPPLTHVTLRNAAAATSGRARRGFRIADRRYSHVLDPRTGRPVDAVASASVIASNAADADGIATVLSVLDPADGLAFADRHGVAALVVADGGAIHTNERWDAAETRSDREEHEHQEHERAGAERPQRAGTPLAEEELHRESR